MGRERRRTCLNCAENFTPDPRNARRQRYCSQPPCQAASKRASQAKWLAKEENRHYHRGPTAVARVQAWRQAHPGYSRRKPPAPAAAVTPPAEAPPLPLTSPVPDPVAATLVSPVPCNAADALRQPPLRERSETALQDVLGPPLQDVLTAQPAVLIGLIAHLWDSALQEDIAAALTRLVQLGRDICGGGHDHSQADLEPGPTAPGTRALQLARSSPGAGTLHREG